MYNIFTYIVEDELVVVEWHSFSKRKKQLFLVNMARTRNLQIFQKHTSTLVQN